MTSFVKLDPNFPKGACDIKHCLFNIVKCVNVYNIVVNNLLTGNLYKRWALESAVYLIRLITPNKVAEHFVSERLDIWGYENIGKQAHCFVMVGGNGVGKFIT